MPKELFLGLKEVAAGTRWCREREVPGNGGRWSERRSGTEAENWIRWTFTWGPRGV